MNKNQHLQNARITQTSPNRHSQCLWLGILVLGLLFAIPGCSSKPDPDAPQLTFAPSTLPANKPLTPTGRMAAAPTTIPGVGNFAQVSPILYRGEQPTSEGFAELKKRGIKTIVNLRSLHGDTQLIKDAGTEEFRCVHIIAHPWHPEDEDVVIFLKVLENPDNYPVFVHCQQGSDRTGYMVAVYRMMDGWTLDEAFAEMKNFNFHPVWKEIPIYLQHLDLESLRAKVAKAEQPSIRVVK